MAQRYRSRVGPHPLGLGPALGLEQPGKIVLRGAPIPGDAQADPGQVATGNGPGEEARRDVVPQEHPHLALVLRPRTQIYLQSPDQVPGLTEAEGAGDAGAIAVGGQDRPAVQLALGGADA